MSPILYHNPVSVPSRAALLTIRNLGLDVEVKVIDIYKGEQNTPEYLSINPLHQVPVYTENGFVVTESRAIICYLASVTNKFYPSDPKKRSIVDSRLFFDATNSFPAIRDFAVSEIKKNFVFIFSKSSPVIDFFHLKRPVLRAGVKKIAQERRDGIIAWLSSVELFLGQSLWIAGDDLTIADFTFLAHVSSAKVFFIYFCLFSAEFYQFIVGFWCQF